MNGRGRAAAGAAATLLALGAGIGAEHALGARQVPPAERCQRVSVERLRATWGPLDYSAGAWWAIASNRIVAYSATEDSAPEVCTPDPHAYRAGAICWAEPNASQPSGWEVIEGAASQMADGSHRVPCPR